MRAKEGGLRDFVKRFVELSGYVKTVYFSNKGGWILVIPQPSQSESRRPWHGRHRGTRAGDLRVRPANAQLMPNLP